MTELLLFSLLHFLCRRPPTLSQDEPSLTLLKLAAKSILSIFTLLLQLLTMSSKTKGKAKKAKGASASVPSTKQSKKATIRNQVPETLAQGLAVTDTEDEVSPTSEEVMAQNMDSMMEMIMDLSHRANGTETQQRDWAYSPLPSLPTMSRLKEGLMPDGTFTRSRPV